MEKKFKTRDTTLKSTPSTVSNPLKEPLKPWQRINWSREKKHSMFREWGRFYSNSQRMETAEDYFDKSIEMKNDDPVVLLYRSKCRRKTAQPDRALRDSLAASDYRKRSTAVDLEISDALYELNEFELCKAELHKNTVKYQKSTKIGSFIKRMEVVNENLKDSLGDSLGPFFLKNSHHFPVVAKEEYLRKNPDPRPQWKIRLEQRKCDVMSLADLEEQRVSPLETARRRRAYKVFNQIYFNSGWTDVLFLKELCTNRNLLMPQAKKSTPILRDITQRNYDIVKKSLRLLHARSPLYNEKTRFQNKFAEAHHQAFLYRTQYQTRRNAMAILRNVRQMRSTGNIELLTAYVEEIMGDYLVLKTHRILPWKYEFVHEIYNILALAHVDSYVLPKKLPKIESKRESSLIGSRTLDHPWNMKKENSLLVLLHLRESIKEYVPFKFGDRSTHQEPDTFDPVLHKYKRFIARLEKRLYFAKYCIERCYLFHEIARAHLNQNRFDDCLTAARRSVIEAERCKNNVWKFLSQMIIFKVYALTRKIERAQTFLLQTSLTADRLKSRQLNAFLGICDIILTHQIDYKKHAQSLQSVDRRKKSKHTFGSNFSMVSSGSTATEDYRRSTQVSKEIRF